MRIRVLLKLPGWNCLNGEYVDFQVEQHPFKGKKYPSLPCKSCKYHKQAERNNSDQYSVQRPERLREILCVAGDGGALECFWAMAA